MSHHKPKSGDDFRKLRNDLGISQGELAERAGVVVATIVNIEKEHCAPRKSTVDKVLAVLCPTN